MQKNVVFICFVTMGFCSCINNEKGIPINTQQFMSLYKHKENAGKRFSIIGYPAMSNTDMRVDTTQGNLLILNDYHELSAINIPLGNNKNEMAIPTKYKPYTLTVKDNDGNVLTTTDKIQVSFTMELDINKTPKITGKDTSYLGRGPIDIRIDKVH